ncbi:MAG: FeoB-associated Cys-rich membrane protein [Clostridia bacterium]|nr:FeoB-associated Cys-rich membrane protein [Clostridia bacterium]
MLLKNLIVILILAAIFAFAVGYIVKAKKSGAKCIGCPAGGCCEAKNNPGCKCNCQSKTE